MIPNEVGRVLDEAGGEPVPGQYVVGWIKRGPSGIIGTNKRDAQETVEGAAGGPRRRAGCCELRRARARVDRGAAGRALPDHVTYADWEAIDQAEKDAGEPQGRPRVKLCTSTSCSTRPRASASPR